jgi:hypothetical protein
MLKLKKSSPAFEMVDGPFQGRKYSHGHTYADDAVPPGERASFEKVKAAPELVPASTTTTESKA